jgi:hypothetical protein
MTHVRRFKDTRTFLHTHTTRVSAAAASFHETSVFVHHSYLFSKRLMQLPPSVCETPAATHFCSVLRAYIQSNVPVHPLNDSNRDRTTPFAPDLKRSREELDHEELCSQRPAKRSKEAVGAGDHFEITSVESQMNAGMEDFPPPVSSPSQLQVQTLGLKAPPSAPPAPPAICDEHDAVQIHRPAHPLQLKSALKTRCANVKDV